jgi:hypothetical protein
MTARFLPALLRAQLILCSADWLRLVLFKIRVCGFKLGEKLSRWPDSPSPRVLQTLANALLGVSARGNIQQALIGFRVLCYGRRFALRREHHGTLTPLELLHVVAGTPPKGPESLDALCDIEHVRHRFEHLFRWFQSTAFAQKCTEARFLHILHVSRN